MAKIFYRFDRHCDLVCYTENGIQCLKEVRAQVFAVGESAKLRSRCSGIGT